MRDMTGTHEIYPFHVEWLTDAPQHYHGPRAQMRQILAQSHLEDASVLEQREAVRSLLKSYSDGVPYF
jgi:hypothetical protein